MICQAVLIFSSKSAATLPKVGTNFSSKNEMSNRRCKPKLGVYYTVAITPPTPHNITSSRFRYQGLGSHPGSPASSGSPFLSTFRFRLKILWFNQRRNFETVAFLAQNAHQLDEHLVFLWLNEGEGRQMALNGNGRV